MSTDDNTLNSLADKVTVILIGIGSAALVVTIYHFIVTGWCDRNNVATRENIEENAGDQSFVTDNNSAAHLIPAFKYQKGMGLGVDDEETCVICLSEYEEGEELKRLPECMHSFHVSCIDMWLFSHSSCPVCRTDAVSPQIWRSNGDEDVENGEGALRNIEMYTDPGMLQNVVLHSTRLGF